MPLVWRTLAKQANRYNPKFVAVPETEADTNRNQGSANENASSERASPVWGSRSTFATVGAVF
jgi:hypothetical protein